MGPRCFRPCRVVPRTAHRAPLTLAALLLLSAPLAAQQRQTPPAGGTPRDFRLPEPRQFTLDNGMGVTLVQYGTVPKVAVQLYVRVGNVNESANEVFLADLTGDLMREGTATRNAAQISAQAAAMGGDVFINTGLDETTVAGDVLGDYAGDFIRLIADIVRNPAFPESELARLKANMVRNITVQQRSPQSQALVRFRETMYPDHPYGRIYPTAEMVNGYTIQQIRDWHRNQWGAQRANITVAGRFDARAVEAAIREAFGSWERGPAPVLNVPNPVTQRSLQTVDRPGAPQSTLLVGIPTPNPSSPEWIPLSVTNTLLGGYFSSRITANLREDKGYTYSPFSSLSTRYRDTYWAENADVTTANTGASLHEIFYEVDRLRNAPPTPEELQGVQKYLAGNFVLANSSRFGVANQLNYVRLHGLGREYLTNYVRNVMAVTPQDVQRIAQQYLDPARMLIVVTGDLNVIRDQIQPYGTTTP